MADIIYNNLDCIEACLKNPGIVPTMEFRIRKIDFPLDRQDQAYLGRTIRPFATEQSVLGNVAATAGRSMQSKNMEQPEFQLPVNAILLGVCALVYVEPNGMSVEGNHVTTQALVRGLGDAPISPDVILDHAISLVGTDPMSAYNALLAAGGGNMCSAVLDWGHPTWKFADHFFKSYRMSVQCQVQSNVHEILNERLVDMGNCCLDTTKEGFSNTAGAWVEPVSLTNERLTSIQGTGLLPVAIPEAGVVAPADMGLFYPLNARSNLNQTVVGARGAQEIIASRHVSPVQAFGGLQSCGAHKWFKFAKPRVIRAHRNIKINLESLNEDLPNWIRMVREASIRPCGAFDGSTRANAANRIVVGDMSSYTAYARQAQARIPGGSVSIGLGLKVLMIDPNMCNDLEETINGMTEGQLRENFGWTAGRADSLPGTLLNGNAAIKAAGSCGCGG